MKRIGIGVVVAVLAGSLTGTAGAASPSARQATAAPVVDLLPGRADARVEVTRDGRSAIVHQGSSYDPEALLKVDLTSTPARVLGQTATPADSSSVLAVAGNRFAYTTDGDDLHVTDIGTDTPQRVGTTGFKLGGDRATLFDIVVTPNGKFAYATAKAWIHEPGSHLLVLKLKKNGMPKVVRRVAVSATHLAVSRTGKRLVAAAGKRLHVFDLKKPAAPKRLGGTKVAGDVRDVTFGAKPRDAYVLSSGQKLRLTHVNTDRAKILRKATLVADSSSSAGGAVAVSADGKRILVTSDYFDDENPSVWLRDRKLRAVDALTGPCYPGSASVSPAGPTKGRMYVADSGICGQARLWQLGF